MSTVLLTGATGSLGRATLPLLLQRGVAVRALLRDEAAALPDGVHRCRGALEDEGSLVEAARGCDVVLHLAALTGKASPRQHERVNVQGTQNLLAAARDVPRFLFVSSIAAGWDGVERYPYAIAKRAAEIAVAARGGGACVLRPTMLLGQETPLLTALRKLAAAPILTLFGAGRARVQPLAVQDCARALVHRATVEWKDGLEELGGPEICEMRDLLRRLRGRRGPSLTVPVGALSALLWLIEPALRPVLPFTAGQLMTFTTDGTAENGPLRTALEPLTSLEEMCRNGDDGQG